MAHPATTPATRTRTAGRRSRSGTRPSTATSPARWPRASCPSPGRATRSTRSTSDRILDLAAARGITVYWLIPPFSPELQARREQKGLDSYTRFARAFLDRYPNLVVLDAQRSGYGASVFLDPAHLDRQGACTLSADVGDLLRARVGVGTRGRAGSSARLS